ncbi:hypothetical protein ACX96H_002440, partial [Acinetobacter baumannii]
FFIVFFSSFKNISLGLNVPFLFRSSMTSFIFLFIFSEKEMLFEFFSLKFPRVIFSNEYILSQFNPWIMK